MSRLFLLRHAKAGWAEPGMRDFDRPLEPLGRCDADAIGAAMRAHSFIPDLVLCSSAKRARETLDWVARHTGEARVIFSDNLYSTDAAGYVEYHPRDRRWRRSAAGRPQPDDGRCRHGAVG